VAKRTQRLASDLVLPELRWLDRCERLLEQAEDLSTPLRRRIERLGTFSRRLDHFFSAGVAALRDEAIGGLRYRPPRGAEPTPAARLGEIRRRVMALLARQYGCFRQLFRPNLAGRAVQLLPPARLDPAERQIVKRFFEKCVFPILTPMAIDASHPTPPFRNRRLYVGGLFRRQVVRGPSRLFGVVEVPAEVSRLVPVGDGEPARVVLLEKVIGAHLDRLFGGYEVVDWTTMRFTRGRRLRDLWQRAEPHIVPIQPPPDARQRTGVVRLEIARGATQPLLKNLVNLEKLSVTVDNLDPRHAVYLVPGPVDLGGLLKLVKVADTVTP
jgi:polyphosphate kinase